MDVHLLGIRHHGPGSAKSVRAALKTLQPDLICIESPADAQHLLEYAGNPGLKPPVAMLMYDPKDFSRASYYPFAGFSPEWQAATYGAREKIPLRFIDLPAAHTLVFRQNNAAGLFSGGKQEMLRRDPLGEIARIAGYSDGERWWDVTFEQEESDLAIFGAIAELMEALRRDFPDPDPLTLAREAYMREGLRQAEKEGYRRAAVVCGAWHVPALHAWKEIPAAKDKAALRGLAKTKIQATWAPWTHERLSTRTGYGAGVIAPAWYDLLFHSREQAVTRWMTRAARLLRGENIDASSALVIDAVVLAECLAALRERRAPGLDELREAAWGTICEGDPEKLALIEEKLVLGEAWGKVPGDIPQVPLQKDMEACIQSARLTKEYRIPEAVNKGLDLRKEANRLASQLLHRLHILGIPWGSPQKGPPFKLGSFSEHWKLKWLPDYTIRIIEAGMWGNTVAEAASTRMIHQVSEAHDLAQLAHWMEETLKASLEAPLAILTARMQEQAARVQDILLLIDALTPLVEIWRYGDARKTAAESASRLIHEIVPRVCIGLPPAGMNISDEVAEGVFRRLLEMNRLMGLLNQEEFQSLWLRALDALAEGEQTHPFLQGTASRLLFDRGRTEAAQSIYFHLSDRQHPAPGARWLEGFLHGSGLLLLHYPPLWQALDSWVDALPMEQLTGLLPILRRTFSRFSAAERSKMMSIAHHGFAGWQGEGSIDEQRARKMEAIVMQLLGKN